MPEAGDVKIEDAVGQELGRMGVQGSIVLRGKSIEMSGGGPPVSIDIEIIVEQWPLLPADMRRRKAQEVARRLHGAQLASRKVERRPRQVTVDGVSGGRVVGAVLGMFAILAAIGVVRLVILRVNSVETAEPTLAAEDQDTRRDRLARACDTVRDRLYKGASFGPFALEGFVVELWLGSRKGAAIRDDAALTSLVHSGKLAPAADDKLAEILDGSVEIADGFDAEGARRSPGWTAATLVFHDGYARAFLEQDTRPRFLGLADRVARASGADHAALYARCAHLPTHDVGAWFRGPDVAGATAVMMYQMGLFAEAKVIDRAGLAFVKLPGGELDALRKAAESSAASVLPIVSAATGSVTTGPPATLVFPFAGPVRPLTATRNLAHKMGISAQAGD